MMRKFLYAALFVFPVIVFIFFPRWTVDDAYIYYRYAANFAAHGALTWNAGQPPVEGYTGVALPAVMAGFVKTHWPPETASHTFGVAAYFLGLLFLVLISREIGSGAIGQLVAGALYAAAPILFTHAFSGLETTWFLAALLATMYALAVSLRDRPGRARADAAVVILALVTSLIRPEGVVIAMLVFLVLGFSRYRRGGFRALALEAALGYVLPALAYFLWRYHYYGYLLPNTFYIKSTGKFTLSNITDLSRFLARYFAAPLAAAMLYVAVEYDNLIAALRQEKNAGRSTARRAIAVILGIFCAILLIQFTRAHLMMNFAYRFYVPLLPLIWLAIGWAIDRGWRTVKETKNGQPLRYRFLLGVGLAVVVYQGLFYAAKLKEEYVFARDEKIMIETTHSAVGRWLKQFVPANEWLAVYMDAGAIPYFSGLKTVDFGGLNDTALAHGRLSPEDRINYFFSYNPGAAVFTSDAPDSLVSTAEAATITADSRFQRYTLVKKYATPTGLSIKYYEFVYLRNDLAKRLPPSTLALFDL